MSTSNLPVQLQLRSISSVPIIELIANRVCHLRAMENCLTQCFKYYELLDRHWSNARHVMCKNIQCCPVILQYSVAGKNVVNPPGTG